MDSRWRNLLALAVVIVVAFVAINFVPLLLQPAPSLSFEAGLEELDSVFAAKNVSFFMENAELAETSKSDILSLKSSTQDFREKVSAMPETDDAEALLLLSDIYLARLDVFLALKESNEANSVYSFSGGESDEEVCEKISVLEEMQSALENLSEKLEATAAAIDSFGSECPEEFALSGLPANDPTLAQVESRVQSNALILSELREVCS